VNGRDAYSKRSKKFSQIMCLLYVQRLMNMVITTLIRENPTTNISQSDLQELGHIHFSYALFLPKENESLHVKIRVSNPLQQ
jgi:hypothetical protein